MDTITFIIPSIGRDSLKNTIRSLLNQTSDKWKAIIVFDGCKNTLDKNDYNEKCTFMKLIRQNVLSIKRVM
jgi:glycosyltransferase involved in cell wall biosynthesis